MKTTFQQSKSLKEIGFNLPVHYYYKEHKDGNISELLVSPASDINSEHKTMYSAPSVSEALQWIRDKKNIPNSVTVVVTANDDFYGYKGVYIHDRRTEILPIEPGFEDAESDLLDRILGIIQQIK